MLDYRETYEEVYDHILTALEQKSQELAFQEAVNQIINDDFGGGKGLVKMEKKCCKSVSDEVLAQQWKYLKSNFEFPNIAFTTMLILIVFLSIKYIPFSPYIITVLFAFAILIPNTFMLIRYYCIGYFTKDTKISIKDQIIWKIAARLWSLFNPGFIAFSVRYSKDNKGFVLNSWVFEHNLIVSIVAICLILYVLSFIKLSREEFKIYMIK